MTNASAPIARISHFSVSFPGRAHPAVADVSLEIHPGECVALVGESGSGKSLTARALLGLLPEAATQTGQIFFGEDPGPANGATAWNAIRGAHASLIPQDALGALDPLRRIELEVGDTLRIHRIAPRPARRARVVAALESAGMPTPERQLRRRSDQLSGGLRQRALVASALIAEPELIIADEPTTALDSAHRARVLSELKHRVHEGAGVLLISHDLASVRDIADRVLVMRDGRIIEQGDPERVFSAPQHRFTRDLVAATPAGKPRGTRLLTEPRPEQALAAGPRGAHRSSADALRPRLEFEGVSAGFGQGAQHQAVLRDISFSVRAGETVGLVGESGSGKTTLIRTALGLHRPRHGQVRIDGVDRCSAGRSELRNIRQRLALVPQDPLDSFPRGATGLGLLQDALRAASVAPRERHGRAVELASEVDLDERLLAQPAATLSGGQRQRLAIARALARGPELLLLDEPVSALDITVQARVLDLLDELQLRHGTAYLLVSHDADVIAHMSDRVLRLENGTIHGR